MPSVPAPTISGARKWASDMAPQWSGIGDAVGGGAGASAGTRQDVRADGLSRSGLPAGQVGQPGVVGEDLDDRDPQPDAGLDALDLEDLVPLQQGHHHAGLAGPGGPARAVQVGLVVLGQVEVDDHVDAVDVEAPGGHVGGHQRRAACRRRSP